MAAHSASAELDREEDRVRDGGRSSRSEHLDISFERLEDPLAEPAPHRSGRLLLFNGRKRAPGIVVTRRRRWRTGRVSRHNCLMPGESRHYDVIFYDTVGLPYTGTTPEQGGLGGSEFQAILLAEAMAARGRRVLVLNNTGSPEYVRGVDYVNHAQVSLESLECDALLVQRYSMLPSIAARRIIIAASDVPGRCYDHFAPLFASSRDTTLVTVSEWQNNLFPGTWRRTVIPNMLPDDLYEMRRPSHSLRFVYASAALKGLTVTLAAWNKLRNQTGIDALELRVCTPGYDHIDTDTVAGDGVRLLGSLPFDRLVEEIAASAGLFYVNTWSETFGVVPAIAEALGRRIHLLCTTDPGGLPETINSPLLTSDRELFERSFQETLAEPAGERWYGTANDFRASRVIENWLTLLDQTVPRAKPSPRGPVVCLSMIVKDEAHVIDRCLRSVKPYVHAWAVVDTGSRDGTQGIIRRVMADLPGELIERPWEDFSTNRNQALALARRYGTHALILDADDTVEADPGFVWPVPNAAGYMLEVVDTGCIRYWRVACPRLDSDWEWRGLVHEALCTPVHVSTPRLRGLHIMRTHNDGARSRISQREKFLRDAEILLQALQREPDNARCAFYLAQSLRDAGDLEGAINAYRSRVSMGGWEEEVYFSKFQIALLLERTQACLVDVVYAYLDAYDYRPCRAEAPCELARVFRLNRHYTLARQFAHIAASLPVPDDVLFIDHGVHQWRARDELAVASYWCGDRAQCARLCRELLTGSDLPEGERERVQGNLGFCETTT